MATLIHLVRSLILCRQCTRYGLGYKSSTSSNPQSLEVAMNKSVRVGLIGKQWDHAFHLGEQDFEWNEKSNISSAIFASLLPFPLSLSVLIFYIVFKVKQTVSSVQPCWVRCEGGRHGDRRPWGGGTQLYSKLPLLRGQVLSVRFVPCLLAAPWPWKSKPFLPLQLLTQNPTLHSSSVFGKVWLQIRNALTEALDVFHLYFFPPPMQSWDMLCSEAPRQGHVPTIGHPTKAST